MVKIAMDLLKASHVGIRELKEQLTTKFLKEPLVITDRGIPISVNLPYSDVIELIDILDEIADSDTVKTVQEGREAIKSGAKGIPITNLFKRIKENR